ncbi:hypothetical protein N7490_004091 [Penicillium lividum]|nr:hypothetical protein N7490_004091 [Penicillium lividum]
MQTEHLFPYQQVQGSPSVVDLTATNEGAFPSIAPSDILATIDHQSMLSVLDDSSLANFLNDFIMPISLDTPAEYERFMSACNSWHAQSSRDLLDFGIEPTPYTGPGYSLTQNMRRVENRTEDHPILSSGTTTPINPGIVGLKTDIFQDSFWRWDPTMFDNCGAERVNISIQIGPTDCPETYMATKCQKWSQNISSALRDKILVLVLSTLGPQLTQTVLSSFPTLGLLNSLMHHFLNGHAEIIASWLHLPTFDAEKVRTQLLLMIIAAGAITCTHPMIQELGFALQEVVRDLLQREFEGDNRHTRDLQFLQAFSLVLEAGLWSGHKRKMEIAESFMLPLITCSMALQTTPLFSYGEISLDLPAAREIWMAVNAHEWRTQYLRHSTGPADSSPTTHYVHEISRLRAKRGIDPDFSAFVVVCSTWSLVWSQLQLQSMLECQPSNLPHCCPATSSSYNQDLRQVLGQIRMSLVDWDARSRLKLELLVQRIMLSLHVSFDLVQTFAGKNGAEAARQSFPLLQRWIESSRSREAIWHAGQILRLAGQSVRGGEQVVQFESICVYHAGLTFWAYSTVQFIEQKRSQAAKKSSKLQEMRPPSEDLVWLDSEYASNIQQFISLGRGTPVVCGWRKGEPAMSNPIYLNDSNAVLRLCISILRYHVEGGIDERPLSLVDNLCELMQDLGRASKGLNAN